MTLDEAYIVSVYYVVFYSLHAHARPFCIAISSNRWLCHQNSFSLSLSLSLSLYIYIYIYIYICSEVVDDQQLVHLKVVPSFIFIGNMIHLLPVAKAICVGTTKLSVLWLYGDRLFVEYVNHFYLNRVKLFFFSFFLFFINIS